MTRDEALRKLRPFEAELRDAGISALYLFGSTARNQAEPDSDLDLIFELGEAPDFSLITHAGLQIRLGDAFGRKVDLVSRAFLRPRVRSRVEPEMVQVFR